MHHFLTVMGFTVDEPVVKINLATVLHELSVVLSLSYELSKDASDQTFVPVLLNSAAT